jgi:transcriptional regulator with XRE-family HTH domain
MYGYITFFYEIASNIRKRRINLGLSIEELAEKSNHSVSLVRQIESGTRRVTMDYLYNVSKALGSEIGMLITSYENKNSEQYINEFLMIIDGLNDKKIQPVLYYLALRSLKKLPRIEKAEYRFVTRKGDYERVELHFDYNAEEKYLTELEKLLDDMASGKFDPVEEKKLCVYCPYSNVCRYYDDNGYGED